jgi:nucleotide-binding universal stress UspA family protein
MPDSLDWILVAHDGSPSATVAALTAIQVAKVLNLAIHGLYVVDEVLSLDTYANYGAELGSAEEPASRADLIARFERRGGEALRWLERQCQTAQVPVTVEMRLGGVPELLLAAAAQAQLLALGRRGHGHAADSSHLGRHFQAIAHQVSQPMLVGGDDAPRLQRLLLAYNGSPHARDALTWAERLQRTLSAEVLTLAVEEDDANLAPQWLETAKTGLEECGLGNCQLLTRHGQPAAEIVAAAAENGADLIVMGGYRHKVLLEWVIGSTVDRVLRATPLPVLVV